MKTYSEACEKIKLWRSEGFKYDADGKRIPDDHRQEDLERGYGLEDCESGSGSQ